jgi:hypothetical protein
MVSIEPVMCKRYRKYSAKSRYLVDILPALKREDSHGTAPLGWDIVVYDVTCS